MYHMSHLNLDLKVRDKERYTENSENGGSHMVRTCEWHLRAEINTSQH